MVENAIRVGGLVTFWSITEWTSHALLSHGLHACGLEKFVPEKRGPSAALRDALEKVCGGPRVLVRPLKSKDGFAVVHEDRGQDRNDYVHQLTARIQGQDESRITIDFEPHDERAAVVLESYNQHLGLLRTSQVTAALVALLDALGGTRLRPTGAIYWLPDSRAAEWTRVAETVEAAGHGRPNAVYLLRHQMDDQAVRAVRDAICTEVAGEARRIDEEVTAKAGILGERALEHRRQEAEALRQKVRLYESILGEGLGQLHEALDQCELAAAKAALLASATTGEMATAG